MNELKHHADVAHHTVSVPLLRYPESTDPVQQNAKTVLFFNKQGHVMTDEPICWEIRMTENSVSLANNNYHGEWHEKLGVYCHVKCK